MPRLPGIACALPSAPPVGGDHLPPTQPGFKEGAMRRWLMVCAIAATVAACDDKNSPSTSISNVAGTWSGSETVMAVTGGPQCLNEVQPIINVQDGLTMVSAQTGTNLAISTTSSRTGQVCNYAGTAGVNSITMAGGTCRPNLIQLTCNSQPRDVYLASRTFTGTVNGDTIAGTTAEQWDVFVRGDKNTNLGPIRTTGSFTFQK